MRNIIIFILIGIFSSACIKARPLEVQQGNLVSRSMIDKLRPGMNKSQVRYILGDPILQDTFNPNRWTYVYSERIGNKKLKDYKVLVYFNDGKLSHFSGNLLPTNAKMISKKVGVEQYTH